MALVSFLLLAVTVGLGRASIIPSQERSCLPPYTATTTFVGCFTDAVTPRALNGTQLGDNNNNTVEACANSCGAAGYPYSGVEFTVQCFCGNAIVDSGPDSGSPVDSSQCNSACPGNASEFCGASNRIDIYKISNPSSIRLVPNLPDCTRDPLCSNDVCDTSLSVLDRAAALVNAMTLDEKINNVQSSASGSTRLALPGYQWDSEGLHGVADSTGVQFQSPLGVNFSSATSFPMPISMAAAFDDALISQIANVIGTEARAFSNNGYASLSYQTPNINPFRDPRWGRGMETPGESILRIQNYARTLVPGLQGGVDPDVKRIIATCKHYAAYDIETDRNGDDVDPTPQDFAEFYSAGFKTCIRDAKAGAVMCSYNAVDGIPSCANRFQLQNVIREHWDFSEPYNMIIGDCGAVMNAYDPHHYVAGLPQAAAVSLNAGTDVDCGPVAYNFLNVSIQYNMTTENALDQALTRTFGALVQAGYFNNPAEYSSLNWADVNTPAAQQLAYQSAVEGMALLKNDGTLPLPKNLSNVAVIGPMTNATVQMQGDYYGTPPYFISPLDAFKANASNVNYQFGTQINTTSTSNFSAAISAANSSDYIIYFGGLDTSIEYEGHDRPDIAWPGNQLDLIGKLASLGKPMIVVQTGGGQIDDSSLLNNTGVNGILWVGYPGQDGGKAIYDVITGAASVAGRLPVTQYPAAYSTEVNIYNMNLRPSSGFPGRTYAWYTGKPVIPFAYGLHYTNFSVSWASTPMKSFDIGSLVKGNSYQRRGANLSDGEMLEWPSYTGFKGPYLDLLPFTNISVSVKNTGGRANMASDYVALLFMNTKNGGPAPYPNKELVSYGRLHNIPVGSTQTLTLSLTLDNIARTDTKGNRYLYPGDYTFELDTDSKITFSFKLTGDQTLLDAFPQRLSNISAYEYLGCYSDSLQHSLNGARPRAGSSNYPQYCVDSCVDMGYPYAGLQGSECYCGSTFNTTGNPVSDTSCNTACPGDSYEFCGGKSFINIYNSSLPTTLEPPTT